MEDNEMRSNEVEAIGDETPNEIEETYDCNAGAAVAGAIGGFLAYIVIDGGKKLIRFIAEKRAKKKQAKAAAAQEDGTSETTEDSE